ncbi:MAG: conjugal transfer protein [Staphylococcus equorum]|nr:conjugal transfer protein [Staphylococcus equorum]
MFGKKKETEKEDTLAFIFEPRTINNGKETITDMSLIKAFYQNFIVTKTGYLVALIETTGINLELLNDEEQTDMFETYNSFLMTTLGDIANEQQQYLDMTIPVDLEEYTLSYKKRYLDELDKEEPNEARANLIASYIDDFTQKMQTGEMSTKKHILVIRQPIKNKSFASLKMAGSDLNEKVTHYINRLEESFDNYDLEAKKLHTDEIKNVLVNLINFTGQ